MNRAKAHALVLLAAAGACLPACGLNQAGVEPPRDTIAFPASAVMDTSGDWLFVTNSNADLRYNNGTLVVLSLERAAVDRQPYDPGDPADPGNRPENHPDWGPCPAVSYSRPLSESNRFCCWDALDRNVLNCDERYYMGSKADADAALADPTVEPGNGNVRIGSFAAAMVLQQRRKACPTAGDPACASMCDDGDSLDESVAKKDHLLIGVRGDTSLTFVDVEPGTPETPPKMTCSSDGEPFQTCDDDHRVNSTPSALAAPRDDPMAAPDVTLPDEPYALALDDTYSLLYVGHLTGNTSRAFSGGFSLFDVMPRGAGELEKPRLIAPFPSPFTPSSLGAVGISMLKAYKPVDSKTGQPNGPTNIYASSRFVPQAVTLGVTAVCPQNGTSVREIAAFPNGPYYTSPLTGTETRGLEVVDGRAFMLQRSPPALISFLDPYTPSEVLETCASPTFLDQHDSGRGTRLFVTCSADGEIYVFDPAVPQLVKTFIVGRGPAGLVFDERRPVAYSVNFGDNDVAVIDLAPGSPTEYHVIQRIGFPRTTPR